MMHSPVPSSPSLSSASSAPGRRASVSTTQSHHSTRSLQGVGVAVGVHDTSTAGVAPIPVERIVLVGPFEQHDRNQLRANCHKYTLSEPVIETDSPQSFLSSSSDLTTTAFVLDAFSGPSFDALHAAECTVYGPPAVAELSRDAQPPTLYATTRPTYATSMRGLRVCFHGYKGSEKLLVQRFIFIIHSLGGSVSNFSLRNGSKVNFSSVTHLVAKKCQGEKYTYLSNLDIPVMQDAWLTQAWERRHEAGFQAYRTDFVAQWRVKPFHGAHVHFLGFPEKERDHMVKELERNGGRACASYTNPRCTHVVVDHDSQHNGLPDDLPRGLYVVKLEWFWASIQMDACADEKQHLFANYLEAFLSPRAAANNSTTHLFSPSTPGSQGKRKKRRTEAVKQLANMDNMMAEQQLTTSSSSKKARSSIGELLSPGGGGSGNVLLTPTTSTSSSNSLNNLLDTPDKKVSSLPNVTSPAPQESSSSAISPKDKSKPPSARRLVFGELVQTEENYVNILRTIMEVFRKKLDEDDQKRELLNQTQLKIIFGNVPPILDVHSAMLAQFRAILRDWSEEQSSVGGVFLKYADDLLKAYPPFVNFFENTKKTLEECDENNPRFHAFLKVCQSRRECGRQTLAELLIRPVQRLGSITLLLRDLLKHTNKEHKNHPDGQALERALDSVTMVLRNINEDKRKTEGQVHIFEIFSDIENCPPHLVSSNRTFLCKTDVIELGGSDELCGKGADLSLFLFSDVLEISKKRRNGGAGGVGGAVGTIGGANRLGVGGGGGGLAAGRSPSTMSLRQASIAHSAANGNASHAYSHASSSSGSGRPHKHIDLMSLSAIRRVVDILDGEECQNCFALICRTNQELKERMFVFQILADADSASASSSSSSASASAKLDFLRLLCRNIANTMYRPDPEPYLVSRRPDELGLAPGDLNVTRGAYRGLHHKVRKAFSFNRTPTTSRLLTRAVSSMISPLTPKGGNSSSNNSNANRFNTTPSGDLQNLRLQSCVNLSSMESPRSSRSASRVAAAGQGMMPPPPPSPARSIDSIEESPGRGNGGAKGGFTLPRTPNICKRRSSFKFLSNSLGKKL